MSSHDRGLDAVETSGVSRQLYYQLEERALKAEATEAVEASLAGQLAAAQ